MRLIGSKENIMIASMNKISVLLLALPFLGFSSGVDSNNKTGKVIEPLYTQEYVGKLQVALSDLEKSLMETKSEPQANNPSWAYFRYAMGNLLGDYQEIQLYVSGNNIGLNSNKTLSELQRVAVARANNNFLNVMVEFSMIVKENGGIYAEKQEHEIRYNFDKVCSVIGKPVNFNPCITKAVVVS
jgi:2',3'-cyclic-nucleotide 2'-phosphodiesterase (5'-nucleotidase family)